MAPPPMLPDFIDATVMYGPDPHAIPGSGAVKQYAAVPSMHVGWAILAGYAIWKASGGPILKGAAALHPALTALVVIVTGHHFISDAVVGAGLAVTFLILSISLIQISRAAPAVASPKTTMPDRGPQVLSDTGLPNRYYHPASLCS